MRRRPRVPKDSLDLLLDTMCNAFGGIVLIAILVALLIEKPGDDSRKSPASGQEARERMRKAKELDELEIEIKVLDTRWEKDRDLIEQIRLRDQLAQTLANRQQNSALSMVELNERLGKALEEKSTLLEDVIRSRRRLAALEARLEENRRQLASLESEMEKIVTSRMSETRPPELRDAGGGQFNLIVRYGEIFPLSFYEFGESGDIHSAIQNEDSVRWSAIDDSASLTEPIRGQGWDLDRDKQAIQQVIREVSGYNQIHSARPSRRMHVAIFVYGDSFDVIDPLRALIDEAGNIAHGWEPREDEVPLVFSTDGKKSQVE